MTQEANHYHEAYNAIRAEYDALLSARQEEACSYPISPCTVGLH